MTAIVLAAVIAQGYYSVAEAQALFVQGNDAYEKGQYAAARQDYERLLAHGQGGPDVLYNLGTAALASGDLGSAVLYLERARRAGGKAEDIEANLAVARSRQLDQVVGAMADEPFVERIVNATSSSMVSWAFLATWCAAFALLLLFRFLKNGRRGWALGLALALLAAAIPGGALLGAHAYAEESFVDGVVMNPTLQARELPKSSAKVSFEIHAGLKVRLMERVGDFIRVRLPNGLEGWTAKDGVAPL
jgi:tetratricopeptide (TPR) repeat protein